jgi:hypothetical protein
MYSYVRTLEDDNADLRRRLAEAEADKATTAKHLEESKGLISTLTAKVSQLEADNLELKSRFAQGLSHAVSSPALDSADSHQRISVTPTPGARASSSITSSPESKQRPSSCIRSVNSTPKKQRVVFNKDLKVAHYHADDYRVFEAPSYPLKGDKSNFSQSSYTTRTQGYQHWTSEGFRLHPGDSMERRSPFSVGRY